MLGLRGRHQYSMPALQSKQSSLCCLHRSGDRGGGGPNGQNVSIKRAADGRRQRGRNINDKEREKYRAKNGFLRNTSTDSKGAAFVILKNHASAPTRKERLSPTSKARRRPAKMNLWKRAGCQEESKALEKSIVERIVREPFWVC